MVFIKNKHLKSVFYLTYFWIKVTIFICTLHKYFTVFIWQFVALFCRWCNKFCCIRILLGLFLSSFLKEYVSSWTTVNINTFLFWNICEKPNFLITFLDNYIFYQVLLAVSLKNRLSPVYKKSWDVSLVSPFLF